MITANYKLTWHGDAYNRKLHRELKRAVDKGAERVRRAASQLLSVSGQAAVTPTGLNRPGKGSSKMTTTEKNDAIRTRGLKVIKLTAAFRARPVRPKNQPRIIVGDFTKQVAFGGTYQGVSRIYWNDDTKRWTTSSAPGTPPHLQSRRLKQSMAVQKIGNGLKAKIGPGNQLKYARIQELGGKTRFGTLPPRPYLVPAFQSQLSKIEFDFIQAIARASQ